MVRKAGLVFGGMVALVFVLGTATAEEKTPSIKEIMTAVAGTKTEKGLCAKCKAAGEAAKWDDAAKYAKTLTECCANLPKHKAPKGDAENWEKLTKQYAEQSKAISKAIEDKDADALKTSVGAFTKACGTCHMSYKGKGK